MDGLISEFPVANVRMSALEAAVSLPVRDLVDLDVWAVVEARRLVSGDPQEGEALAEELHEAAADSRTQGPITALSYAPEPRLGEMARIELSALVADDNHPTLTADLLHRYLATPTPVSYRPPEAERHNASRRPGGARPARLRPRRRPGRHGNHHGDLRVRHLPRRETGSRFAHLLAGPGPHGHVVRPDGRACRDGACQLAVALFRRLTATRSPMSSTVPPTVEASPRAHSQG